MEQAARALGLRFSRGDPAYPGSIGHGFPFELFSRGIEQTCENVMSGTIDGVAVTGLDFLYVQQVADDSELRSEPVRYACAVAAIGGDRPPALVEPAPAPAPAARPPPRGGVGGGGLTSEKPG